jgi:hypothetical protein
MELLLVAILVFIIIKLYVMHHKISEMQKDIHLISMGKLKSMSQTEMHPGHHKEN